MLEIVALVAIISLAGLVQGLTGFGSVLVALPLLSLFIDIRTVIPLATLFALVISLNLSISLWPHIRWKRTLILLAFTAPGIPLGIWMLKYGNVSWLQIVLGMVLVCFSLNALLSQKIKHAPGNGWAALAGFSCGFLSASIGAGGPPVIIYASSQPWHKDEIKALMAGYFLITGSFVSCGYVFSGLITLKILKYTAISIPTMLLAVHLGQRLYNRLSGQDYRKLVQVLILCLGLIMVYRSLTG